MKMQVISNSTKAILIRFGAAILLFMTLTQASAKTPVTETEPFVNITYAGSERDQVQFQLDLVNDKAEAYLLTIKGDDGTVLYKEKIDQKIFTKRFAMDNSEFVSSKLTVNVTGLKSKKTQSFEIFPQVRTVREVIISKK